MFFLKEWGYKEASCLNDADVGEIKEVNETIVVTEKGGVSKDLSSKVYAYSNNR